MKTLTSVDEESRTGVFSWCLISWFYFLRNVNLENYSSWLVIWRFCVTREEPEFFYRYSWFYYSIPHDFETQVLPMVRDVYRERLVCDLQYGAIRYDLAIRDSAFFKHCFYCKNRSLKRVFYSLIFVNRENEIVMPVIRDVHESCQRPPCTTLDENHQGQATHIKTFYNKKQQHLWSV